jgi:hypothetical protein
MPINRLLKDGQYTPDEIEFLNRAFSQTLNLLGLADRNDRICEMVARAVIEIGANGTKQPRKIAELAVARIGLR